MSGKKPYSDKRWTQPLGGRVISHIESTPEEREESRLKLEKITKEMSEDRD